MAPIDRVGLFRGTDFQKFCSVLLSASDPTFQSVDGSGGDLGNDGFVLRGGVLFQAYAPEHRIAAKVRSKIDDSIAKAQALRRTPGGVVDNVVFLTPFDLTPEQHAYLAEAASKNGLAAESWGEAKLLALLAEKPAVKREFPELLIPDVVEEIRTLQTRIENLTKAHSTRLTTGTQGAGWQTELREITVLDPPTPPALAPHTAAAFFRLRLFSLSLRIPSLEPLEEDRFLTEIISRFWEDAGARFERSDGTSVHVQNGGEPEYRFHRRWLRSTNGCIAMAATLPNLHRPDSYSLADLSCDVVRFLRLAVAVGASEDVGVEFTYEPHTLVVALDLSDRRASRLGNPSIGGILKIDRPQLVESRPKGYLVVCRAEELAANAHKIAAEVIVPTVKDFHLARIDTARFAESLPLLLDASRRASLL